MVVNLRSSYLLPAAKDLSVAVNLSLGGIAFLITVFFFSINGATNERRS